MSYPLIRQVVIDCLDARASAEFYRQLFGMTYRPGDEPGGPPADWLVLRPPPGGVQVAFQQVDALRRTTWPEPGVSQQLHLDTTVPTKAELDRQHERAVALGARLLHDRSDHPEEPLRVYADLDGHPFCIFVAPPPQGG